MPTKPPAAAIALENLRLADALALLGRGGATANDPLHTPIATADSAASSAQSSTEYLQSVIDGLCELSLKDPLTGLFNRRQFHSVLERTIDMVARSGEAALLLMLDIDHFKKVNDTYGHPAGDQVLRSVAKTLEKCVRSMDTVARYGGEEFAVILPNCHTYFGQAVAERIRQSIESTLISIAPSTDIKVTVSVGGAYAPEWVRSTVSIWTERADAQLYRAKEGGRNRVVLDMQQEIAVSAEEKNMLFGHLALGNPAWIEPNSMDATAQRNN